MESVSEEYFSLGEKILAASRLLIPGEANSRARRDSVMVSREANKIIGAVVV